MGGMVSGIMGGIFGSPKVPQPAAAPPPPTPQAPQVQKAAADDMQLRAGMGRASTILTQPDEDSMLSKDNRVMATKALGM
jgi:hypothetical protein